MHATDDDCSAPTPGFRAIEHRGISRGGGAAAQLFLGDAAFCVRSDGEGAGLPLGPNSKPNEPGSEEGGL